MAIEFIQRSLCTGNSTLIWLLLICYIVDVSNSSTLDYYNQKDLLEITKPLKSSSRNAIFHSVHNCSHYCPVPYNISSFTGTWNYIELFSETELSIGNLKCLKLTARIVDTTTMKMNVTLLKPSSPVGLEPMTNQHSSILIAKFTIWWNDERKTRQEAANDNFVEKGRWTLFSNDIRVPSKWIILSNHNNENLLYITCGEFPDGTCAVAEIGVISRNTQVPDYVIVEFESVLAIYNLHTVNRIQIRHDERCLAGGIK